MTPIEVLNERMAKVQAEAAEMTKTADHYALMEREWRKKAEPLIREVTNLRVAIGRLR